MSAQSTFIDRFGIIIGAMRAGTTALFQALGQNPEIALARKKETNFFVSRENFSLGMEQYATLWDWRAHHKIAVEASTSLTKEPQFSGAPERMASAAFVSPPRADQPNTVAIYHARSQRLAIGAIIRRSGRERNILF
jgi:hypothetical protein